MPVSSGPGGHGYQVESVTRACELLRAFRSPNEALRLRDVVDRTGLEKTVAFRLLRTLEAAGFVRRRDRFCYLSNVNLLDRKSCRIGYAALGQEFEFSTIVTDGVRRAAAKSNVDLLILDNQVSAKVALRNAQQFIDERVDLVIEFQTHERVAPTIASMFREAAIPVIAVDIPHPGASFYGANNYRVGLIAGRYLGRWAKERWNGEVDEVLLMGLDVAGALPELRLTGAQTGIREMLPTLTADRFSRLDCRGDHDAALSAVRKHLRPMLRRRRLVVGVTDLAVMGALKACEEAGLARMTAGLGQGALPEARLEMRRPGSPLLGAVAYFPERYGDDLIALAIDLLGKRHVPPAVYAPHALITAENVRKYYPADVAAPVKAQLPAVEALAR